MRATKIEHERAGERTHYALQVGKVAALSVSKFMEDDDGSRGNSERISTGALRDAHDVLTTDIISLEGELIETFRVAPLLPNE